MARRRKLDFKRMLAYWRWQTARRRWLAQFLFAAATAAVVLPAWAEYDPTLVPAAVGASTAAVTMDEVVVTGQKGVSSLKYTEPLKDTPQSITVIPQEVIQDQGATTLRETLRNVPGISLAAGEAGAQGDNLTIRGFSARSDIFLDGMRDFGSYYRDPFNYEQVEALKGPASAVFGRGSTGGTVNQVSKAPHPEPFATETLALGTDVTKRATVDINRPLSESGRSAFRLNLMGHSSRVAGRPVGEWRRFGLAPSLAFGIGSPSRLTLSYLRQSEDDIPDYGIPYLLSRPAPVPHDAFYGFKDGNFLRADADIATIKAERDLSASVSLREQVRYAKYARTARITEPQIPAAVVSTTPVNSISATRKQIATDSTETSLLDQLDLSARFNTGPLSHALVSGLEAGMESSNPARPTYSNTSTNLMAPDQGQSFNGTVSVVSNTKTTAHSLAAYLLDTVKLGDLWALTGGVRWDRFAADYRQTLSTSTASSAFDRTDRMVSWRGALVFKPSEAGSLYTSFGTSFNPSAEGLSLAANTAEVAPEKSRTWEFGGKWEVPGGLSLNAAVFRDEKVNARTPDPNNALLNVLSGEQRVQGFELGATGYLTKDWEVFSGYATMNSKVVRSNNPLEQGNPLANAPKQTFNVWSTYALPRKVEIGAGADAVTARNGRTTVDAATGLISRVPGYVVFNALVKWEATSAFTVQVNFYNLTDKFYLDTIHPAHLIPGAGRSALVTTTWKF